MTATAAAPVVPRFLERTVDFQSIRADADDESGDGRTFEGYAAVFGSQTRIDSWEGRFEEQIAKGAFRKSIRDRMPVLQFDHGRNSRYGSIPIGAIRTLKEDEKGLHVVARMHGDPFFGPLREAIGSKSINGMSFRFEVVKEDWHYKGKRITDPDEVMRLIYGRVDPDDDELVVRTLKELKVPELGPVVFPAYADTTASVRSFEMARALEADAALGQQVRASIARAMVVKVRNEDDADPPVENAEKPDNITTETAPEPVKPEVVSEEAPPVDEPPAPEGHSETEVEPPAVGHSEPDSDSADEAGRSNPAPPVANWDAQERHLARQRMAASIRGVKTTALDRVRKYS